jgi:Ca-activated chloride channel family protein
VRAAIGFALLHAACFCVGVEEAAAVTNIRRPIALALLLCACGSHETPRTPARGPLHTAAGAAPPTPGANGPSPSSAREVIERLMRLANHEAVELSPLVPGPRDPLETPHLVGKSADGTIEFALAHTSVHARVTGSIAHVEVQQLYQNPTANRLEAVYQFPLPENAAVTDMLFRIRNRVVVSEVRRRAEAKQVYEDAKREGKAAALTEQERPNLFTQSVANIPPGESVEVILRYVHEIKFDDGRYTFVFPTTIGPRYVPASVTDAERVTPPVVPPGMRSAHDIEIAVELLPGAAFTDVAARSHRIETGVDAEHGARLVTLAAGDTVPNKDFILGWRPAGKEPDARLLVEEERDAHHFMLFVQPPAHVEAAQVRPKQMVFLIDKSGSMMGEPIETAKRVIKRALAGMGPDDTFQLVAFDSSTEVMSESALGNTPENVRAAGAWLETLSGGGGTEMLQGIIRALELPTDPRRLRMVVFCTDGFIGNEPEIIDYIAKSRGEARVFGFGIGSSVNRYLIEGVGRAGRGAAEVVRLQDPVDDVVARLYKRLDRPVLTDIALSFEGLDAEALEPARLPDLFAGQPLVVVGRAKSAPRPDARVTITGKLGTAAFRRTLPLAAAAERGTTLGTLWARRRIEELTERRPYGGVEPQDQEEIVALALQRKLITQYTSFVAVERELKVDPSLPLTRLLVPNEMPEGVKYEGIFGSETVAQVTPVRIKPGDPELRVQAPDATRVSVELPFFRGGAPLAAVRDGDRSTWVARFLVPSGWPDGSYDAHVIIERIDGARLERTVSLRVDTTPPAIAVVGAPETAQPGATLRLAMKPALPLDELLTMAAAPNAGGLGWTIKGAIDVKQVLVRAPWGEVARARMDGTFGEWIAELHVPDGAAAGPAQLEIVAVDTAGNTSRRTLDVHIGGALRAPVLMGAVALLALALLVRRRSAS